MKLNADVGEGFGVWSMGNDHALMPHIDMANVAGGGHASDPLTMSATVRLAKQYGVAVGAHPSYPDLLGFGRRALPMPHSEAVYIRSHKSVLYRLSPRQRVLLSNT